MYYILLLQATSYDEITFATTCNYCLLYNLVCFCLLLVANKLSLTPMFIVQQPFSRQTWTWINHSHDTLILQHYSFRWLL